MVAHVADTSCKIRKCWRPTRTSDWGTRKGLDKQAGNIAERCPSICRGLFLA